MSVVINDLPIHSLPQCGKTSGRLCLLSSRAFEMLGDGDTAHRICPEGGGFVTISVEKERDGLMSYRYKCTCGLYSIES